MSKYIASMKTRNTLSVIATIRETANQFIIEELEKHGVKGMVPSHGAILNALYMNKSMTMKEIANAIRRKQPTVTVLIDKLAENGYVKKEKDRGDTRITNILLTKKGEEFQTVFLEISQKLNKKMHKGLNDEEMAALQIILDKIMNNF